MDLIPEAQILGRKRGDSSVHSPQGKLTLAVRLGTQQGCARESFLGPEAGDVAPLSL